MEPYFNKIYKLEKSENFDELLKSMSMKRTYFQKYLLLYNFN